jgi:predicted DNA-binding transcriptional regulator YafY
VIVVKSDDAHFVISVSVAVSQQFLAWIASFGDEVRILSPETVVDKMKKLTQAVQEMYL